MFSILTRSFLTPKVRFQVVIAANRPSTGFDVTAHVNVLFNYPYNYRDYYGRNRQKRTMAGPPLIS